MTDEFTLPARFRYDIPYEDRVITLSIPRLGQEEGAALRAKYQATQAAEARAEARKKAGETFDEVDIDGPMIREVIAQYVRVEAPRIWAVGSDGEKVQVVTGAQFVEAFGARYDVLKWAFLGVVAQTDLTLEEKKVSPSPTDSEPSSDEPDPALPGPRPESPAPPAGPANSAGNGAATPPETAQSGWTGPPPLPSSSANAPSSI